MTSSLESLSESSAGLSDSSSSVDLNDQKLISDNAKHQHRQHLEGRGFSVKEQIVFRGGVQFQGINLES